MEAKVGAYAKRCRALFALPSKWATRILPEPSVVSAVAAIVDKEGFQELCQTMRRTLGVGGGSSALGDGARKTFSDSTIIQCSKMPNINIFAKLPHSLSDT